MNKNKIDRLKNIEIEIAYLRKEIESFMTTKPIEIHNHYVIDYGKILEILEYFKKQFEK